MLEEAELIKKTKQGDSESLEKLVTLHTGMLVNVARKNSYPDRPLCNFEEQFSNRYKATYEAAQTYPEGASHKFITHLVNTFCWDCIENLENLLEKDAYSYDPQDLSALNNNFYEDVQDNIEDYISLLPDEQMAQVLRYRYIMRLTWETMGAKMGFSRTRCQQLHEAAIQILKKKLKSKLVKI